jgi:EmrB/QacA subfamily drug resistance transporter
MHRFGLSSNVLIIAAAILGSSVVLLGESVVSLALPSIGKTLQVPFASLQWVADGYNLTLASCILFGGSLGDIFGLRRVYLWSAGFFLVLSLVCALAWSGLTLILFRALLGIAGALLTPVSLALLNAQLPKDLRMRAVAYWTAATSIMLAAGPLVGGYLVDLFSWRAIFLFNVPLALIAMVLGNIALKKTAVSQNPHIDWLGAILAFLFLAGITFGLIEGPANHWPATTIGALVAGLLCFIVFIWWERHTSFPLVDIKLFEDRNFAATNAATVLLYAAFGGFGFLFSYFLQTVSGFSATAAGATFLPVSVMLGVASGQIGKYSSLMGPRWFMGLGPLFCAAGMLLLLPLGPQTTYLSGVLPGILLFGVGLTLTVAPLTATALNSAPDEKSGIASAINNGLASAGPLIAIALLGLGGLEHVYVIGVWTCIVLAALAGLVSLAFVRNPEG